jgi:hypothetical protein
MASMPSKALGADDRGEAAGHGFEDLVLDAASDAHRHDGDASAVEPGEGRRDPAAGFDAVLAVQGLQLGGDVLAHDQEAGVRPLFAQRGPDALDEALHGVEVGAIVHYAGEDERVGLASILLGRAESLEVHAVGQHRAGSAGDLAFEELPFDVRDDEVEVHLPGELALELEQQSRLAPVDPAAERAAGGRILTPLVGVELGELHDLGHALERRQLTQNVLPHRGGVAKDEVRTGLVHPAGHRLVELRVAEIGQRDRLLAQQVSRAEAPAPGRGDARRDDLTAAALELLDRFDIGVVLGEGQDPHTVAALEKCAEDVPRRDAIAPVGGIGNALGQEEDLACCVAAICSCLHRDGYLFGVDSGRGESEQRGARRRCLG